MPQINFTQAKEFLEKISSEDKVAIIHHNDTDGFASGILLYDWCKQKGTIPKTFTFVYKQWKEISLEEFDKILIADVAPGGILDLNLPLNKQILYTDHHPKKETIPEEIFAYQTAEEGYIPSSRTVGELTGLKPWLALSGTISDAADLYSENDEYLKKGLEKYNLSLEEFKKKIDHKITNFLCYFHKNPNDAFEILKDINTIEEIEKIEKYSEPIENEIREIIDNYESKRENLNNATFYHFTTKYNVKKPVAAIISRNEPRTAFIFAIPKMESDHQIELSARNQSRKIDTSKLLEAGISGLENAQTGGHFAAAGATIETKDLDKFKENIRRSR